MLLGTDGGLRTPRPQSREPLSKRVRRATGPRRSSLTEPASPRKSDLCCANATGAEAIPANNAIDAKRVLRRADLFFGVELIERLLQFKRDPVKGILDFRFWILDSAIQTPQSKIQNRAVLVLEEPQRTGDPHAAVDHIQIRCGFEPVA